MGNKNGKERELNCSVPTIRRFSEFKFVDTALSKEDLTDQDRENTNLRRSSIATAESIKRNVLLQSKPSSCKVMRGSPSPVQKKMSNSTLYQRILFFLLLKVFVILCKIRTSAPYQSSVYCQAVLGDFFFQFNLPTTTLVKTSDVK